MRPCILMRGQIRLCSAFMIGTTIIESLVQATALSHLVKGQKRVSLLMMAAPESGKTTIATAATAKHICRIAVISGRSIIQQARDNPSIEFLLFNDLSSVRAMSTSAVNLLVVILNQITQDEPGIVAFAGNKEVDAIDRPLGIIGCIPFQTFVDHRAKWKELGFISRMIPFAYQYPQKLVATIKDGIDDGAGKMNSQSKRRMPKTGKKMYEVKCPAMITRHVRHLADTKAAELKQLGIRLLQNYHCLIRAHALLHRRFVVNMDDLKFLVAVDAHVSITECKELEPK